MRKKKFLISVRLVIETESHKEEAIYILAEKIRDIKDVTHIESLHIFE